MTKRHVWGIDYRRIGHKNWSPPSSKIFSTKKEAMRPMKWIKSQWGDLYEFCLTKYEAVR